LKLKGKLLRENFPPGHAALPLLAAVGGVILPVLIYSVFNNDYAATSKGWGIAMAADTPLHFIFYPFGAAKYVRFNIKQLIKGLPEF